MSFLGQLFSSSKTVDKTVDAVINTGDKMFYTDEEKAEGRQKMLDWVLAFHDKSSGSNVARRLIAVMVVGGFLILVGICAVLILMDQGAMYAKMYDLIRETLKEPVGIIIAFYFLSGMVRDWSGGKKKDV